MNDNAGQLLRTNEMQMFAFESRPFFAYSLIISRSSIHPPARARRKLMHRPADHVADRRLAWLLALVKKDATAAVSK